jgi:NitT/TauT family transport system substrate-binding protein
LGQFIIQPHSRLQEWVAEEKGYYAEEGLDYLFRQSPEHRHRNPTITSTESAPAEVAVGAFESMEAGRACDVSSACHWAVGMAASADHGRMWGHAYSVTPSGVWVAPESGITTPSELAGVEVAVGIHSGSHFSALQVLEPMLGESNVKLKFVGGPLDRLQLLLDRRVDAGNVFGVPSYVLEQQGFRKIVDTSFMIGFLIEDSATDEDAARYFRALQRAQRDIDVEPDQYKHYFLKELPEQYHALLDTRRCGIGERLVFEPYTREVFERTHRWMVAHDLFPKGQSGDVQYEIAVVH